MREVMGYLRHCESEKSAYIFMVKFITKSLAFCFVFSILWVLFEV